MIRAAQLGYVATAKWDVYDATYDIGTQDYSAIGPGADGWPLRPVYHLLQLMTLTTSAGRRQHRRRRPGRGRRPREAAHGVRLAGEGRHDPRSRHRRRRDLDDARTAGLVQRRRASAEHARSASSSGTPTAVARTSRSASSTATRTESIEFSVPLHAVFALTNTPLGASVVTAVSTTRHPRRTADAVAAAAARGVAAAAFAFGGATAPYAFAGPLRYRGR